MSNVVAFPNNFGPVSTRFAAIPKEGDLSAGVQQGFGIIGYKGKVWSTRYRGVNTDLMRADGDGPMNSIEVVILKASAHVSKIWYENGWVEGSNAAPDCFSTNGITPDMQSKKKQANACALCPKNQWGSRITPQGKPGKACGDSKRLAVVPLPDIKNEGLGGPMLMRVPAASLGDLAAFGEKMQNMGYQYFSIGIRIAFDAKESYPKFVFSPIRPLSDSEADLVLSMRDEPAVARILAEGSEHASAPAEEAKPELVFEQPKPEPTPAPAPKVVAVDDPRIANELAGPVSGFGGKPVQTAAPETAKAPVTPQVTTTSAAPAVDETDFEKALDAQLNDLLPA
ncbi:MAG: hypothetical protein ACXWCQ_34880 [Burkholderiales bacterium]